MPSPAQIKRFRQRRRERASRWPGTRLGLGCGVLLSLAALLISSLFTLAYILLIRDLPSLDTVPSLLDPPNGILLQPTRLYDRTNTQVLLTLENPAATNRQYLSLDSQQDNYLPATVISATLVVADPGFWSHPGYSLQGVFSGEQSTLAQRLASDLLLNEEPPGFQRAVRERLLASQLTKQFGREKILIWFLNSANYGRLAYGIDAAARVYFDKPAAELTLAEAALLAATLQTPALNPLDAPKVASQQSQAVLQSMVEGGWISNVQANQARKSTPVIAMHGDIPDNPASTFLSLALEDLEHIIDRSELERGGFRIVTSLEYDLQLQAACVMQIQFARLAGEPEPAGAETCIAARLLAGASPAQGAPSSDLAGNLIVLDHRTGQILALVGEPTPGLDPARYPGHPAGSLWTPFIYLTGFTRGLTPASLLWDLPVATQVSYNPDGTFHGPLRLRTALANDDIAPAVAVIDQVGAANVWRMARQLGLEGAIFPEHQTPSALLDEGETTLLEISRAYGVWANQGLLAGSQVAGSQAPQAITILRVEDARGRVWLDDPPSQIRPVISPQLAYLLVHILSDENARWQSFGHPNPLEIGRPFAAKVGRTVGQKDAWAIGSTPDLTFGVWLGSSQSGGQAHVSSRDSAVLLHAISQYASQEYPPADWSMPVGISVQPVCDPSGMLATPECPTVVNEIFLTGSEPTQFDTLYRRLQINRESGFLATVFTPPEQIEERVYMLLPPEAQNWARQAGLPTPPESFDVILSSLQATTNARIASPELFAYVRGQVEISGDAGGPGFELYRLQVGQGLNPQRWIQIGADGRSPVVDGKLGIWETSGLSGLYAIQLTVIYQDQRVQTDVIQVTVDNQPPEVRIISPVAGEKYTSQEILFQTEVSDDLALNSVEFLVDREVISTLSQPPFALTWTGRPGMHTLKVKATDQAGNMTEVEVLFQIE